MTFLGILNFERIKKYANQDMKYKQNDSTVHWKELSKGHNGVVNGISLNLMLFSIMEL
jgi:hypothetical protein